MRQGWFSDKVEDVSDALDSAAERLHPNRDGIKPVPDRDRRLIKAFPSFLAMCLVIWVCCIVYLGDYSFSKLVEILCLAFVACFAALGVPCLLMMDRGVFNNWIIFLLSVFMTGLLWISEIYMGQVYYAEAIYDIMDTLGFHLDDIMQFVLGFGGTLAILFFTSTSEAPLK